VPRAHPRSRCAASLTQMLLDQVGLVMHIDDGAFDAGFAARRSSA
jgi:hypothetical protein